MRLRCATSLLLLALGAVFIQQTFAPIGRAAMATPAGPQLPGHSTPSRYTPLILFVTQTAVSAGLLLVGLLAQAITAGAGWRAALDIAALAIVIALLRRPPAMD